MTKFTWKALQNLLEQHKLSPDDAMQIILDNLFGKDWKHGSGGKKLGRMWRDPMIVSTFTHVLAEEDKLAKTITRKKVQQELFQSDVVTQFIIVADLKYKTYLNFKNDYSRWKRLPMFKPSWVKGTITIDKAWAKKAKKLAAKNKIIS